MVNKLALILRQHEAAVTDAPIDAAAAPLWAPAPPRHCTIPPLHFPASQTIVSRHVGAPTARLSKIMACHNVPHGTPLTASPFHTCNALLYRNPGPCAGRRDRPSHHNSLFSLLPLLITTAFHSCSGAGMRVYALALHGSTNLPFLLKNRT